MILIVAFPWNSWTVNGGRNLRQMLQGWSEVFIRCAGGQWVV
jgi:hypothetical protein